MLVSAICQHESVPGRHMSPPCWMPLPAPSYPTPRGCHRALGGAPCVVDNKCLFSCYQFMVPFSALCYREGTSSHCGRNKTEQKSPPASRATLSVEDNLSSLSCWLLPHSLNCSLGKGLKRKRTPNPTSLSKSWGLTLLLFALHVKPAQRNGQGQSVGSNQHVGTTAQLPLFSQAAVMTLEA